MLRMEIALFLVLAFVAYIYFSAEKEQAALHKTFAGLLITVLSEEFHMNAQYISQLFKSEIGVNFLVYLTNIRMENAKKLLLSTPLSVAEVAERSGYGDYRVFTKAFKKSEGVTPSQYRRNFLDAGSGGK